MPDSVGCVTRSCTVDTQDDIAVIEITLQDAVLHGPIVIAHITEPFCNIRGSEQAVTTRADGEWSPPARVHMEETPRGKRFELSPPLPGERLSYQWRALLSAGCPLSDRDLRYLRMDRRYQPIAGFAFRPFRVRFPCERLVLQLTFKGASSAPEAEALVLEPQRKASGHTEWVREKAHFKVAISRSEDGWPRLRAEVEQPSSDRRYAIAYRPMSASPADTPAVRRIAEYVLKECRASRVEDERTLPKKLEAALLEQLASKTTKDETAQLTILGQIWHEPGAHLLTCFGRFSVEQWGVAFPYGAGVAGYAFRFAKPLAYYERAEAETRTLIYVRNPSRTVCYTPPPQWVIAIPIRRHPHELPIGVLSISTPGGVARDRRHLERLAEELTTNLDAVRDEFTSLSRMLIGTFWRVIADHVSQTGGYAQVGVGKDILAVGEAWTHEPAAVSSKPTAARGKRLKATLTVLTLITALLTVGTAALNFLGRASPSQQAPSQQAPSQQAPSSDPVVVHCALSRDAQQSEIKRIREQLAGQGPLDVLNLSRLTVPRELWKPINEKGIARLTCPDGKDHGRRCDGDEWVPDATCPER
jgi:hypothetical protein